MSDDIRTALRDVLDERACYESILDKISPKGPFALESERVLLGALLAGDAVERDLLPCRALDFSLPMHQAVFIASITVPGGRENTRLAKIVALLERDGCIGARDIIENMLGWRDSYRGDPLQRHIRSVFEAGRARRAAGELERLAKKLRIGQITVESVEKRLKEAMCLEKPIQTPGTPTRSGTGTSTAKTRSPSSSKPSPGSTTGASKWQRNASGRRT